ncbi:Atu4866 domain-containing protein [Streptomonospora nanhaiensis]|uniref:Uncharacterized protein n=1 Tax=Streptomonospora nanhaiensis TaxID=1323731 RepID=A0A853BKL0_9ACTN|nr:Atu4866 domain-containing protein [Streptomonospora nanhaiensis]MBV2367210.1 Atu4866 domain-containing protein [Streptomonospora nanhaiensis]MBX9391132.1 Atu4866 domain-containing protein [Streptomonospora nanhaiensis]NYI95187.1 hypothetical protein [Streptomonospora nanhaiensis]
MAPPAFDTALLEPYRSPASPAAAGRPLLFAHARVHTFDPAVGDLADADVLTAGAEVAGVGPGLRAAAEARGAVVLDCAGLAVVPAVAGPADGAGARERPAGRIGGLAPGGPATFAVVPAPASGPPVLESLIWRPENAVAVLAAGRVVLLDGRPAAGAAPWSGPRPSAVDGPHLGRWVDDTGFIVQDLAPGGRYDEARGGRPHAYQGAFWIAGDRIVYRDDLGFWAYGRFCGGVLHHAGYTFRRRGRR